MRKHLLVALAVSLAAPLRAAMREGTPPVAPSIAVSVLSFTDSVDIHGTRADLLATNTRRAAPAIAAIKALVGKDGSVRSSLSVSRAMEYDPGLRAKMVSGLSATRAIEVTLRGGKAIKEKLSKIYDNSRRFGADVAPAPVYASSPRQEAAARRQAKAKHAFVRGLIQLTRWQTGDSPKTVRRTRAPDAIQAKTRSQRAFIKTLDELARHYR